jgi:hypothetical protein
VPLTERQKLRIAKIIERHTSWTIGWYVDEDDRAKMYADCAASIAQYLERSNKQLRRR